MKKLLLLAIVVLGFSAVSFGQAISATANASGTLVTAINIVKYNEKDLNFGNIVAGVAGTVKVDKTGARSTSAPVLVPQGVWSAAEFKVTGTAGYTYTVTLPPSATTVTTTTGTGTKTMSVDGWESSQTGTLDASGEEIFKVGGVLNIAADQAAGTYTSSTAFSVTVNYN